MSRDILSGATFNPGAKTLDFSGVAGFDPRRLRTVIHGPSNAPIFLAGGGKSLGGTWSGSVLTLATDLTGMLAGDPLTITVSADNATFFTEAINQPLSNGQVYTGQVRDSGGQFTSFGGMIFSTSAGIMQILASADAGGSIQYVHKSIPVTANSFQEISVRLACRYARIVFVNQGDAGTINLSSSFLI